MSNPIGQLVEIMSPDKQPGDVTISYSQYSMWANCPMRWKLKYIDKHRFDSQSIHTVFGSAMHTTLQSYLQVLFNDAATTADKMDLPGMLKENMGTEYRKAVEANDGKHISNKSEMTEYLEDGIEILNWIRKHRADYFSNRTHELVGIELPIRQRVVDTIPSVLMIGFLDIVLKEKATDTLVIIDIKTSGSGWNKHQKEDKTKTAQLIIYKEFLARQLGYDADSIDIKYMIVKRKLSEVNMFQNKRVQVFVPPSGKPTRKKLIAELERFIVSSFNADGTYKTDVIFPALAGPKFKNCKYCEFNKREDLCSKENRVCE